MLTKQKIKNQLQQYLDHIADCGVKEIGLFGSYVREEQHEKSYIDFLISFEENKESFDNLMKVYDLLESIFKNKKIEIVTTNGLSPFLGSNILEEVEYVN